MGKILDLSIFKEDTLDIRLLDGTLLHISKPTQRMVIEMLKLKNISDDTTAEQLAATMDTLVLGILNSNRDGRNYNLRFVMDMQLRLKHAIINAYAEYITGVQANPNSSSRPYQKKQGQATGNKQRNYSQTSNAR